MIKIMIVDDRPQFREYLKTCIDWNSYGFEICCEGKNGEDALIKAQEYYPDIVLSDINMPKMDGLELSEKLLELNPDIGIVLITGYSKFEYARKAVKIGVTDYILKPFEKEELIITLLKLQDNINKTYEAKLDKKNNLTILRNSLLNKILSQEKNLDNDHLKKKFKSYGIHLNSTIFKVAVIDIDKTIESSNEIEENLLWKQNVSNILKEIVDTEGNHFTLTDFEGRIISIIEFGSDSEAKNFELDDYMKLKDLVTEHLNFSITIGIGNVHEGFYGLRKSYIEAINALNSMYYLGKNKIIKYDDIPHDNKKFGFYSTEINETLLKHLRSNDLDKTIGTLKNVFFYAKKNNLYTENIKIIHIGLMSLLLSFIVQSGKNISDIFGQDFSPYKEFENLTTEKDQQNWIIDLFTKTIKYNNKYKNTRSSIIAEKAKDFIMSNYSDEELTVTGIARSQYINQTYLRSMFKKELNMTVSEYITKVRMEEAKKLLKEEYYKLSDIADMVGYKDPCYFSKSFKKYYGISPSKFR